MNVVLKLESNVVNTIFSVSVLIVGGCITYLSGAVIAAFGRYRVWTEGRTSLENHFREASLIGALCGAFKSRSYIRTRAYVFLLIISLTALVTESLIFVGIRTRECKDIRRVREKNINAICMGNEANRKGTYEQQTGKAIDLYEEYLRSGGSRPIRVSHLPKSERDRLVLGSGTNDRIDLNIDQMLTTMAGINLTVRTDSNGNVETINPVVDLKDQRVLRLSNGVFDTSFLPPWTQLEYRQPKGISFYSKSLTNESFLTVAVISFALDREYTFARNAERVFSGTAEVIVFRTKGKGDLRPSAKQLGSTMAKNVSSENIDNKHIVDDMIAVFDIIRVLARQVPCERKVKVYKTCTEITPITFAMMITQGSVLLTIWGFYIFFWLKTRKSLDWNSSNERFVSFLENAGKDVTVIDKGRLRSFISTHEFEGSCKVKIGAKELEATPYVTIDQIESVKIK